jgi:hypothetical protein
MRSHLCIFTVLSGLCFASAAVRAEVTQELPSLKNEQFFSRDLTEAGEFSLEAPRARIQPANPPVATTTLPEQSLDTSRADITLQSTDVPQDLATAQYDKFGSQQHVMGTSRYGAPIDCHWRSPAFCHRPLYFEQVALERYGVTNKVAQPVMSAARFYGTLPLLPVLVLRDVPEHRPSTLGYERPGSPVR